MAYASLVSLAQTIQHILQHDDQSERQSIRSLCDNVVFLQSFLEEFMEKVAEKLEGQIRDVANEAENIFEHFVLKEVQSFYSHKIKAGFGNVMNPHHQYDIKKLCEELERVTLEIDSLVGEVMEIKNSVGTGDLELIGASVAVSSSLLGSTIKDPMVGFDEELMAIKTRLCGESSKLQVIPIVGMGGIGKTTLARNAYDDPLIVERFDIRAWVTISQDYSAKRVLSELLASFEAHNEKGFDERNEKSDERVYKNLKGRRYLIVMDDMWSTNVWDDVRRLLPDDNNGSRIMLTTRLSNVAANADRSSTLHEMQFMDLNQSWNLLRRKVFKDAYCPKKLEGIGRTIALSCRGLPLAIVVIAGILCTVSQTPTSWASVADNVKLSVTTNEEQFTNILSLSYNHLPHHLRPCFLYMGGFPEAYKINVTKLIKLWIAECFIKTSGSKSYEESAEEYLEDLVKRSLVLVTERKPNGKIKSCNLHDLVWDLCIRKAQEEMFLFRVEDVQKRCGGFSLRFPPYQGMLYRLEEFRLLRVLDALEVTLIFDEFPTLVLELIFLRYLALSFVRTRDFDIPSSISRLQNLQTLCIRPCQKRSEHQRVRVQFPSEIWRMKQLRHLVLVTSYPLPDPCPIYSALENLQTLAEVMNFRCTEGILQTIPNLRKLGVVYDNYGLDWSEYQLENLVHLHQLEKLNIRATQNFCRLWGNPAFPVSLRKLKLTDFQFCSRVMKIIGSLPNLEMLKLTCCYFEDRKWETNEGEFPVLKFLQIRFSNLQQWETQTSHFPRLKCLMLCNIDNLTEIPDVIGEIPTLELIEVYIDDKSLVESAKRIKEEQQSFGNDNLQVRVLKNYQARRGEDMNLDLQLAARNEVHMLSMQQEIEFMASFRWTD